VALVIGANDVTNPAALHDRSSPIYGMPILDVDRARTVMVIKRGMSPGFAGIDNELYYLDRTLMVFGDAKAVVGSLVKELAAANGMHEPEVGPVLWPSRARLRRESEEKAEGKGEGRAERCRGRPSCPIRFPLPRGC
jgi:hypothetical protein